MSAKDMLGPLMRALVGVPRKMLGLLLDIVNRLDSANGDKFYSDLAGFVKHWRSTDTQELLTRFTEILSSSATKFVAGDAFGPNNPNGIKFRLGADFERDFLSKVENDVVPATVIVYRLERSSQNSEIIDELGKDEYLVGLKRLYDYIKVQRQDGSLFVGDCTIIAYAIDIWGTFQVVCADWNSTNGVWYINANRIDHPTRWHAGDQVLSW
jgi:hypothetical protein